MTEVFKCTEFRKFNLQSQRCYKTAIQCSHTINYGWQHDSVVRTSVFGRQTFPALRLIHG